MMKNFKYYIVSITLMFLGACTQDIETKDTYIEGKGAFTGILPMANETRTTLGADKLTTYWATGDILTASDGTTASNYTLQDSSNGKTTGIFNGNALTAGKEYYAIYPATALTGTSASVTIAQSQNATTFKNNDIKVAKAIAEINDGLSTACFKFNQIAAKLEVDINLNGAGIVQDEEIIQLYISAAGKNITGTCNVDLSASNPTLTLTSGGTDNIIYYFEGSNRRTEHASILMIPGDLTSTTLKIQIYTRSQAITVVKKPTKAYEPGMSYALNLKASDFINDANTKIEYMMGGEYDMGDFVIASAPLYTSGNRYCLMTLFDNSNWGGNFAYGMSVPYSYQNMPTLPARTYIWGGGDNCGENLTTTTQTQGTTNEDPCVLYDKQINGWTTKPAPYRGYRLPTSAEGQKIAALMANAHYVTVKCGDLPGNSTTNIGYVYGEYTDNGDNTVSLKANSLFFPNRRVWVSNYSYANWVYGAFWTAQDSGGNAHYYTCSGGFSATNQNYIMGVRCVKGYAPSK